MARWTMVKGNSFQRELHLDGKHIATLSAGYDTKFDLGKVDELWGRITHLLNKSEPPAQGG